MTEQVDSNGCLCSNGPSIILSIKHDRQPRCWWRRALRMFGVPGSVNSSSLKACMVMEPWMLAADAAQLSARNLKDADVPKWP